MIDYQFLKFKYSQETLNSSIHHHFLVFVELKLRENLGTWHLRAQILLNLLEVETT